MSASGACFPALHPSPARGRTRRLPADRHGIAALEFALVVPVILAMFGGFTQIGLGVWARGALADAVSQGAYYAFVTYATKGTVQPSAITSVVQTASTLSGVSATATQPASYCTSTAGGAVTLTAPPAATGTPPVSTCPDGTTPGTYTTIGASYATVSFLPAFTGIGSSTLQETVTVRLQ